MAFPGMLALIELKKLGGVLADEHIRGWVSRLVAGTIPDYQTASLLMAIRLMGMNFEETLALTQAMAESGERLQFQGYPVLADKHSTGGVGDKVTLILAPMLAACGLPVSMLSGRALGFSGGTIDKFEALEGVSCHLDGQQMQVMLDDIGWVNAPASEAIAPADRILYALRDVTGTVDSIPLITASILAKKLSGGASHLCLDVKCGGGAFMTDLASAKSLAENLQRIGEMGGLHVSGLVSHMDEPLGHAVGNYLELMESVAYLRDDFPDTPLSKLVFALAEKMLTHCGTAPNRESARQALLASLSDGSALEKLTAYLRLAGAKESALEALLVASYQDFPRVPIIADAHGYVHHIAGRRLGELAVELGAGRKQADDVIDPMAGFLLNAHLGDPVSPGDVIAWMFGTKTAQMNSSFSADVSAAFTIAEQEPNPTDLILHHF